MRDVLAALSLDCPACGGRLGSNPVCHACFTAPVCENGKQPKHKAGSNVEGCGACHHYVLQLAIPPETEWDRIVWRAMLIATDYATCCALLRDESVPPERIDWDQARRFERR